VGQVRPGRGRPVPQQAGADTCRVLGKSLSHNINQYITLNSIFLKERLDISSFMQRFFKVEEKLQGLEDQVAHAACRKYVTDMHHEARVQAHIDYYASSRRMTITKTEARQMTLTRELYLEVDE